MKFKNILLLLSFILLASCSGGGNGGSSLTSIFGGENTPSGTSNPDIPETPPAEVETEKLQVALNTQPEYKIDNSEIEALKAEGIITEEDVTKIQAIQ